MKHKETLNLLKKFKRVSVNNKILYDIFSKNIKICYLPNGVDTDLFVFKKRRDFDNNFIHIGWVGNIDRNTKNFRKIELVKNYNIANFNFRILKTRKSEKYRFSQADMVNFYNKLDFFLVVSSTEGTPNPALEAASCGVPLITTSVGNMPELVINGKNGFFINHRISNVIKTLKKIKKLTKEQYQQMSRNIYSDIRLNWSWHKIIFNYKDFFNVKN